MSDVRVQYVSNGLRTLKESVHMGGGLLIADLASAHAWLGTHCIRYLIYPTLMLRAFHD